MKTSSPTHLKRMQSGCLRLIISGTDNDEYSKQGSSRLKLLVSKVCWMYFLNTSITCLQFIEALYSLKEHLRLPVTLISWKNYALNCFRVQTQLRGRCHQTLKINGSNSYDGAVITPAPAVFVLTSYPQGCERIGTQLSSLL